MCKHLHTQIVLNKTIDSIDNFHQVFPCMCFDNFPNGSKTKTRRITSMETSSN